MIKLKLMLVLLTFTGFLIASCGNAEPRVYTAPDVRSFVAKNDGSEFVILLAYGGSSTNSIAEPVIDNDNGNVQIRFTNNEVGMTDLDSLNTSFRSFSGADRQASAVIKISEEINRVSYYYKGQWKQVWPLLE